VGEEETCRGGRRFENMDTEGFPGYISTTHKTEYALYIFVAGYSILSFLLIAPLVLWAKNHEKRRKAPAVNQSAFYNPAIELEYPENYRRDQPLQEGVHHGMEDERFHNEDIFRGPSLPQPAPPDPLGRSQLTRLPAPSTQRQSSVGKLFRELDKLASTAYPDEDPDFMSAISGSRGEVAPQQRPPGPQPSVTATSNASQSNSHSASNRSNPLSAATTSRLYQRPSQQQPRTQIWDINGRRWKNRRPIGRVDTMQRAIRRERTQTAGNSQNPVETRSLTSRGAPTRSRSSKSRTSSRGLSDVASSVLDDDSFEDMRPRPSFNSHHRRRQMKSRGNSISSCSEPSALPSVNIDDISPNDAADADDPGRVNSFEQDEVEVTVCCGPDALWKPRTLLNAIDGLIELAEPDLEMRRIISIGVPLTFGAIAQSLFHVIIVAFIGNFIGTDSMVAYVLVSLLVGFTDDLVGAIADAESTLCSHALSTGDWLLAGQYAQIGVLLNLLVSIPILAVWVIFMDDVILWLTDSENAADLALRFTKIIAVHHLLQSFSKTFTVLFNLTGDEHFETRFGIVEGLLTLVAICCTVSLAPEATLEEIGQLHLLIGASALVAKMVYACYRGWMRVFFKGLRTCAVCNVAALCSLLLTSMPLFIGAFLEYGQVSGVLLVGTMN